MRKFTLPSLAFILLSFLAPVTTTAQVKDISELDQKFLNWYLKDQPTDQMAGTSTEKAYAYLQGKPAGKTIIVAVIDSGVDIEHVDLKNNIWKNEDEIPGNGIDDDFNGYIDDVYGWNFIGNKKGENIHHENLEYVRIVRENNDEDPLLARAKTLYDKNLTEKQTEKESLDKFQSFIAMARQIVKDDTGIEIRSEADLDKALPQSDRAKAAKKWMAERYTSGFTDDLLTEYLRSTNEYLDKMLNLDFEPRKIIGDDPKDITDVDYGNPDVTGPRAEHGTGVSGVIAAVRGNGIGIDGIATNVKIMAIRTVPMGDERDKDVALAIRYAVDNGANIINMSFGKDFSPEKSFVDAAVKHAEANNVLLVHGAGNDAKNIDLGENYPTHRYLDTTLASNWLTVGASTFTLDKNIAASFSNYGAKDVDLFAPGESIITLDTVNHYNIVDGTSFSAPIVSGVAALVWSYYPELTAVQLKEVLLSSAFTFKKPKKVLLPDETSKKRPKAKFVNLSTTGGLVNAYHAVLKAEELVGNQANVN